MESGFAFPVDGRHDADADDLKESSDEARVAKIGFGLKRSFKLARAKWRRDDAMKLVKEVEVVFEVKP